ncbi:HupE/UreJ family protein [Flavobacterium sp.]|uniref:HupE/UreJ family protein n=1 Tax=Flavobacterium sp. TaxID=239 RepID=UPI003A8DEB96
MSEFQLYFQQGLYHVLDINAYDHILFIVALTVPYVFKDWKNVLLLVTLFTIGHSMSLILAVYDIVSVKSSLVEFLIPVTIFITAVYNIFRANKSGKRDNVNFLAFTTLFFGIIHGLGFSNYFKMLVANNSGDKLVPLAEFALGIEVAQVIIVLIVLILSWAVQTFLRFSQRDWILVTCSFVAGVVVPMIIHNRIW